MPRRDGTGPMGAGSMTGRGLGLCTGANAVKYGAGLGWDQVLDLLADVVSVVAVIGIGVEGALQMSRIEVTEYIF